MRALLCVPPAPLTFAGDPERNKNGVAANDIPQYLQDAIAADLAEEKKRQEERQRDRDSIKFRVYYLTEDRHITVLKTAPIGDILVRSLLPKIFSLTVFAEASHRHVRPHSTLPS